MKNLINYLKKPKKITKGVVLAGGSGTRLNPLTKVTNKALLPVYDKPMIFYSIETMISAGIDDIIVVCGGNNAGDIFKVLGSGKDFNLRQLHYVYQEEPKGIADALALTQEFAENQGIALTLSDNIFEIAPTVNDFTDGGKIFVYETEHPEWYGCLDLMDGKIVNIIEKPKVPPSNWIVTGFYIFDNTVWEKITRLKPSGRGELEITDIINFYLKENKLNFSKVNGFWRDAGENIETYMKTCIDVYNSKQRN